MFTIALKNISFFRKRFILMSAVLALMVFMICSLTGLTAGLFQQNTSKILNNSHKSIVLNIPKNNLDKNLNNSILNNNDINILKKHDINDFVGLSTLNIQNDNAKTSTTVFGSNADDSIKDHEIVLSQQIADDLKVNVNDSVKILGHSFTVKKIDKNLYYSHTPVVDVSLVSWQDLQKSLGQEDVKANFAWTDKDNIHDGDYRIVSKIASIPYIGSARSEIGSLAMMIGLLIIVSTLVIGAFFIIWTNQRQKDLSIMKALGGTNKKLSQQILYESLITIITGIIIGLLMTEFLTIIMTNSSTIPFNNNFFILFVPTILIFITSVLGSLLSLFTVIKTDPISILK